MTSGSSVLEEGVGLGNTRMRLHQLYGDAHSFVIGRADSGGTLVAISIPLRGTVDTAGSSLVSRMTANV